MGYGMMGRPKEIVIRYSQKVPIPVREAIAHTTWGLFATEPRSLVPLEEEEEEVSPPVAVATDAE